MHALQILYAFIVSVFFHCYTKNYTHTPCTFSSYLPEMGVLWVGIVAIAIFAFSDSTHFVQTLVKQTLWDY